MLLLVVLMFVPAPREPEKRDDSSRVEWEFPAARESSSMVGWLSIISDTISGRRGIVLEAWMPVRNLPCFDRSR